MAILERVEWQEKVINHKEWIVNLAGYRVPLAALDADLKLIFLIVSLALCYYIGMLQQALIVKVNMENAATLATVHQETNAVFINGMKNLTVNSSFPMQQPS